MLLEKINNEPAESEGIENLASVLVDYVNKEISQLKVCIKVIGDIADFNLYGCLKYSVFLLEIM